MKRSLLLILLTLSLLVNPAIFAGQGRSHPQRQATAPSQGAAVALAPQPQAQLANHILPNGLEVIVLEDHSIPLITIEMAVKNGSYTEPPELNGLSHL